MSRRFFRSRPVPPNPLYRNEPKRTRPWAWVLLPILLLAGFAVLAASPRYTVRSITVTASPSISAPRVQDFVTQRISGRLLGLSKASQFLISTSSLASQIRHALGNTVTLKALSVQRRWPDGLTVNVQEAGGAYTLSTGKDSFLLDAGGAIVSRVQGLQGALLPVNDPMELPWQIGEHVLPADRLDTVRLFVEDLAGQGIGITSARLPTITCYPEVSSAEPATNTKETGPSTNSDSCDLRSLVRLNPDIFLMTSEGWDLEVSLVNDRARQLADLDAILSQKFSNGRSDLHSVDVRIPGRAYYR